MAEEVETDKGNNATSKSKSSVFDRLQPPTPQQCPSIFSGMGNDKTSKLYVLQEWKKVNSLNPLSSPESKQTANPQAHCPRKMETPCLATQVK